ncbi:hypothetical protein BGZ95_000593 [Linnemannia exigua]|uniref:C3H1-type domain-containing protein n=1 Tax=Linnemannia exigua TaxID=604196 RepID=A0AAD4D838_9FUNG|nr:hypothetical protein BGZ95_000593 [Linnemannia exigua]
MSSTPCRFFLAGTCRNGTDCRFYHEGFSGIPRNVLTGDATQTVFTAQRSGTSATSTTIAPRRSTSGASQTSSPSLSSSSGASTAQTQVLSSSSSSPSSSSSTRPAYAAARPCNWYMAGYCLRGDNCWFSHDRAVIEGRSRGGSAEEAVAPGQAGNELTSTTADANPNGNSNGEDENEDQKCAICFEIPSTFGLLASPEQKEIIIQKYKVATARRPCKYFKESGERHWCPFGDECFFAHLNAQGQPCKVNPQSNPRLNRRRRCHHHHDHMGGRNLRRLAGFEGISGYSAYGGSGQRATRQRAHRELMEDLAFIQMSTANVPQSQLEGLQGLLVQLARLSVEDPNFDPNIYPQLRSFTEAFEEVVPSRHNLRDILLGDEEGDDDDDDDEDEDEDEYDDEDDVEEDDDEDADSETTLERDEREAYEEFGDDFYFQTHFQTSTPQGGWAEHDIDAYHDFVWAQQENYR